MKLNQTCLFLPLMYIYGKIFSTQLLRWSVPSEFTVFCEKWCADLKRDDEHRQLFTFYPP